MRRSIYVEGLPHENPVPAAMVIDNVLASGLINGRDPRIQQMPPGLKSQCDNMFASIRSIMTAAGGSVQDILKVTVWVNDRKDRSVLNEAWVAMFPDRECRPARSTLNRDLGGGKLIECEILAVLGR